MRKLLMAALVVSWAIAATTIPANAITCGSGGLVGAGTQTVPMGQTVFSTLTINPCAATVDLKVNFIFTVGQLQVNQDNATVNGVLVSACNSPAAANYRTGKFRCDFGVLAPGDVAVVTIGFVLSQTGGPYIAHEKWHDTTGPVGNGLFTLYGV